MALAALIIAILAFIMAGANLVIYLSKNVFSTHTVQLQPVENFIGPKSVPDDSLTEFDAMSVMDLAFKEKIRTR